MSATMLRVLIVGALFAHGVGHSLGFFMPSRSWLMPGLAESALRAISSVFWVLSIAGFLAACLAYLGIIVPHEWWRRLAVIFACISLLGLIVFLGDWPTFNTVGAIGMNIAILVTQLWLAWPRAEAV